MCSWRLERQQNTLRCEKQDQTRAGLQTCPSLMDLTETPEDRVTRVTRVTLFTQNPSDRPPGLSLSDS